MLLLVAVAYYTLAERKIMASLQRRLGPNVVLFCEEVQPILFLFRDTLPGYFPANTGAGIKVLITTKSILWVREQILWVLELAIQKSGLHKYPVLHIWTVIFSQ